MKVNLEINNKAKSPIGRINFEKSSRLIIKKSGFDFLNKKNIEISLAFISEKEIKEINRRYRKNNRATDVLSFAEFSKTEDIKKSKDREIFLGELIICYDDIAKYTKKEKINLQRELINVFSHGLLHLLCFRHGKKMFEIQNKIIENI